MARTIADLAAQEHIAPQHVAEAPTQYRSPDRAPRRYARASVWILDKATKAATSAPTKTVAHKVFDKANRATTSHFMRDHDSTPRALVATVERVAGVVTLLRMSENGIELRILFVEINGPDTAKGTEPVQPLAGGALDYVKGPIGRDSLMPCHDGCI